MGLSFPILQRAVQDDPATSGWKAGVLQAANIAGCVAGSLVVGLVTLTLVGTPGTMRLLLLVGLVFAGRRSRGARAPAASSSPLAALLVLVAVALPGTQAFWMRLHGTIEGGDAARRGRDRGGRADPGARTHGCGRSGRAAARTARCRSAGSTRRWAPRPRSCTPRRARSPSSASGPGTPPPPPAAAATSSSASPCSRSSRPNAGCSARLTAPAGSAGPAGPLPGRPALHDPRRRRPQRPRPRRRHATTSSRRTRSGRPAPTPATSIRSSSSSCARGGSSRAGW